MSEYMKDEYSAPHIWGYAAVHIHSFNKNICVTILLQISCWVQRQKTGSVSEKLIAK